MIVAELGEAPAAESPADVWQECRRYAYCGVRADGLWSAWQLLLVAEPTTGKGYRLIAAQISPERSELRHDQAKGRG